MSNLPNKTVDRLKIYPNEYITSTVENRPNLRLLANDIYLESLVAGVSGYALSGMILVDPPASRTASGNIGQIALSGQYMYVYHTLSGSVHWGRIPIDYSW